MAPGTVSSAARHPCRCAWALKIVGRRGWPTTPLAPNCGWTGRLPCRRQAANGESVGDGQAIPLPAASTINLGAGKMRALRDLAAGLAARRSPGAARPGMVGQVCLCRLHTIGRFSVVASDAFGPMGTPPEAYASASPRLPTDQPCMAPANSWHRQMRNQGCRPPCGRPFGLRRRRQGGASAGKGRQIRSGRSNQPTSTATGASTASSLK